MIRCAEVVSQQNALSNQGAIYLNPVDFKHNSLAQKLELCSAPKM